MEPPIIEISEIVSFDIPNYLSALLSANRPAVPSLLNLKKAK